MRVATYSQPATATRGSVFAWMVLVLTVLIGTSCLHTLVLHFAPQAGVVTASILWLLLYFLGFLGLMFSQGINWISWLVRYRILLVVLLLGTVVSISWSVDAALSAERTVHLLGTSVIAIYLGFMVPLLTILRISAGVLGFIMLGSVAASVGMPDLGIENYEGQLVWKGILNSKNSLGFWSAISVLLFITLSDSVNSFLNKTLCYLMAAISLLVLLMSDSATSILAMVMAGSLSLYLYLAFRFQLGFARMAVMAVLFIGLIGLVISNIDTAEILGRSGDLTGRGEVWAQTWQLIMREPLTGYGYGALWFPNDDSIWIQQRYTDFTWVVYHAHNGFLQVASEIGLPLSVIALLMVVQQLIEIFYCQYQRQQVGVLFVLAFVITFLISNFSEARFLVNRELYWIFFVALPISMLRQITLVSGNPEDWLEEDPSGNPGRYGDGAGGRANTRWDDDADHDAVDVPGSGPQPAYGNAALSANPAGSPAGSPAGNAAGVAAGAASMGAKATETRALTQQQPTSKPWSDDPEENDAEWQGNAHDDTAEFEASLSELDISKEKAKPLNTDFQAESESDADPFLDVETLASDESLPITETAEIDLGEVISEERFDVMEEDPHDRVIHPGEDDISGLDDFDDFDDDQYDRLIDDER